MLKTADMLDSRQRQAIDFINSGEDSLIAADVGTGKTVISMTAIAATPGTRWLVLAPRMVALLTWAKEAQEWEHLQHLKVALAIGSEKQRLTAVESDADIVVMNYENLSWLMRAFPKPRRGKPETLPFDGLICDEIDKLRNVSSNRFKDFRNRIGMFSRRIGLTGTVLPKELTDIWGQVYMVDGGQTFGRSFYRWRDKFFYPTDFNRYQWAPFPGTKEKIVDGVSDLMFRLEAEGLPDVAFMDAEILPMGARQGFYYRQMDSKHMTVEIPRDDATGYIVTAENAAVAQGKLQQITAGFLYVEEQGKNKPIWFDSARQEWVADMLHSQRLRERQKLIFYHFDAEFEFLKKLLPGARHLGRGQSDAQNLAIVDAWNRGGLGELLLHPESAGHGLNLQKSGCEDILFTTQPWTGGMMRQVTGRLARRGALTDRVYVHTSAAANTVDERVMQAWKERLYLLDEFLYAIPEKAV